MCSKFRKQPSHSIDRRGTLSITKNDIADVFVSKTDSITLMPLTQVRNNITRCEVFDIRNLSSKKRIDIFTTECEIGSFDQFFIEDT